MTACVGVVSGVSVTLGRSVAVSVGASGVALGAGVGGSFVGSSEGAGVTGSTPTRVACGEADSASVLVGADRGASSVLCWSTITARRITRTIRSGATRLVIMIASALSQRLSIRVQSGDILVVVYIPPLC